MAVSDLDDYYRAIRELQTEIEVYGTVASTLQNAASVLLKSHRTSEATAKILEEQTIASSAQLRSLQSDVGDTLATIQQLNLDTMHVELTDRYDRHQERLDRLVTSVEDAVREQQRLGLQLLNETHAFKLGLEGLTGSVSQVSTSIAASQTTTSSAITAAAEQLGLIRAQLDRMSTESSEQRSAIARLFQLAVVTLVAVTVAAILLLIR